MSPPRLQPVRLQPQPSSRKKVQLIYKLFLLGNAWNTLKGELRNLIHEAYEEAQSFLNSSFTTCEFSDLLNALDKKCEAIDKLSALLKDLMVEPQACVRPAVKTGLITNHIQPLLKTDVLKFGPMLQNRLMASSIAKAVQVLGATLSPQQLKHFIISQPAVVQENDMICSISPSCNSTDQTFSTAGHLKDDEKKQAVIFEESQPDPLILPPAIIKSPEIGPERSPQLEPTIQAIFPEISNPNPMKITPLIGSGWEEDLQVQHQKQTSSQLLHFLRARTKIMGALEVTVTQWSKSAHTSGKPQSTSPAFKTQRYQSRHVVTDGVMEAPAPTMLCTNIENEAPVFRVKTVESCGSLTYTCVIATKTELWDMGDVVTEVQQAHTDDSPVKDEDCQNTATKVANSSVNSHLKPQTPQGSAPKSVSKSACAKPPAVNGVTIPTFHTRKFEEIEVVVSHIVSPGNFYIQHADSITKLCALVTDSWKASSSYAEQNCIPDIGTQVMGWFPEQGQWCRAQVTKICGISRDINCTDGAGGEVSMKVEVKMLDYGGTSCLSLLNVKELTPEMAILPLQAAQVSLANVTPVSGRDWSKEAVGWFKTMVNNRTLYARLYPQGPKVTVELFLEKGKLGAMRRGASLSLRLAQNGHAKHTKLKNIGPVKRSTIQLKMTKQDSDWEKYLISHYTQHKK